MILAVHLTAYSTTIPRIGAQAMEILACSTYQSLFSEAAAEITLSRIDMFA